MFQKNYNLWICFILVFVGMGSIRSASGNEVTCCKYCRSQPGLWYRLGGAYVVSPDNPQTALDDPPAYLVEDVETVQFTGEEGREFKLQYAGAPIKLTYNDLSEQAALLAEQYVEIDLESPKKVGGAMVQGGFYVEKNQGIIPYRDSWTTEYVVSYSNDTDSFSLYRSDFGNVEIFPGPLTAADISLASFSRLVTARYLRVHPLRAQNEEGSVVKVSVRVTAVTCDTEVCFTPRINCLLSDWAAWSECTCGSACARSRERRVRRVQACGGERCADLRETETCVPPQPAWKTGLQYFGIALAVAVVIILIAVVAYKMKHRNRVQDIIIVKDHDDADDDDDLIRRRMVSESGQPKRAEAQGAVAGCDDFRGFEGFELGHEVNENPPPYSQLSPTDRSPAKAPASTTFFGYDRPPPAERSYGNAIPRLGGLGGLAPTDQ